MVWANLCTRAPVRPSASDPQSRAQQEITRSAQHRAPPRRRRSTAAPSWRSHRAGLVRVGWSLTRAENLCKAVPADSTGNEGLEAGVRGWGRRSTARRSRRDDAGRDDAGRGAGPPSRATQPLTAPALSVLKGSSRSDKPTAWSRTDMRVPVPARGVLPMGGPPGPSPATAERIPLATPFVCSNRSGRPCDPLRYVRPVRCRRVANRAHGPRCPSSPRECAGASPGGCWASMAPGV